MAARARDTAAIVHDLVARLRYARGVLHMDERVKYCTKSFVFVIEERALLLVFELVYSPVFVAPVRQVPPHNERDQPRGQLLLSNLERVRLVADFDHGRGVHAMARPPAPTSERAPQAWAVSMDPPIVL